MFYQFGPFVVDKEHHKLYRDGEVISNDEKTTLLLALLCKSYPEVLDKEFLIEKLWVNQVVSDWSLSKLVSDVRQLLRGSGKEQDFIKTVRGKGFRLNIEATQINEIQKNTNHLTSFHSSSIYKRMTLVIASLLIFVFISYFVFKPSNFDIDSNQPIRVGVLPIINEGGDPANEWIKYGIMSIANEQLSNYQSIQTIPISTMINLSADIDYKKPEANLFEKVCRNIGCSHLVIIKHKLGEKSNPILTYQILKRNERSPISDFSQSDIIDTADMLLDYLASDLLPDEKDHYSLTETYSNDSKANRDYAIGVDELINGDLKSAKIYLDLALNRKPDFLWALSYLAELEYRQGNLTKSIEIIEKLNRRTLSDSQSYFIQHLYSNILYSQGKLEESIQVSIALKSHPIVLKNSILMGNELLNIGSSLQSLGKMEQAITYLHESQIAYKEAEYGSGEGKVLYNIANVYLTTLRKNEAIDYYQKAREVFKRFEMTGYALMAKQQIATTNLSLGKIQNAESELLLVIEGYKTIGDLEGELTATSDLINVSFAKNNSFEAKERAEKLLQRLQSSQFSYLIHHTYALLTKASLRLGELKKAEKYFALLQGEWEDIRPEFIFMQAHIEQQKGHLQQALNTAKKIKEQLGSRWLAEHQSVLLQFEQSVTQDEVIPIDY